MKYKSEMQVVMKYKKIKELIHKNIWTSSKNSRH